MAELLIDEVGSPSLPTHADGGLDRIGVALADPIRRAVLVQLLDGRQRPSVLADAIGTSRSNLSNHLACLKGCGLVVSQRCGRHLDYSLVSTDFAAALRMLLAVGSALPTCHEVVAP